MTRKTLRAAVGTFGQELEDRHLIRKDVLSMRSFHCAIFAIAVLLLPSALRADVTGAILGTVTDPSGAGVPGAKVTLRNVDTGSVRTARTDDLGGYEFLAVPVGEGYTVSVEAAGFQK